MDGLLGYALALTPVVLFITGVISWGFGGFYMFKTMNRFHPDRSWGKYVAISLFIPWFFTDEGNKYRVRLLWALTIFFVSVAGCFGIVFCGTKCGLHFPTDNAATTGIHQHSLK